MAYIRWIILLQCNDKKDTKIYCKKYEMNFNVWCTFYQNVSEVLDKIHLILYGSSSDKIVSQMDLVTWEVTKCKSQCITKHKKMYCGTDRQIYKMKTLFIRNEHLFLSIFSSV